MSPFRWPEDDELRAVCMDHNTCPGPSVCACTCHVPSVLDTVLDVLDDRLQTRRPQPPGSNGASGV